MAKRCSGDVEMPGTGRSGRSIAGVAQRLDGTRLLRRTVYRLCTRIAGLQNEDGYWHASLLDRLYPSPKPVPPVSLYMRWPMA